MKKLVVILGIGVLLTLFAYAQDNAKKDDTEKKNVRSIVLIDSRLFKHIENDLKEYIQLAEKRRKFGIMIEAVNDIDDWGFEKVREYVKKLKSSHAQLEGILFIGNIKMPSLYSPRGDNFQTRCLPIYYQDLDMKFEKRLKPGEHHTDSGNPKSIVPQHDFDYLEKGKSLVPSFGLVSCQ